MADRISRKRRSWLMSRIAGSNTTPEILLRKAMFSKGIRGWRLHAKDLPGRPDIVFRKQQLAIFVDGAFWHGHPYKFSLGRLSAAWEEKILSNRRRDRRVNAALKRLGWTVLRFWDLDLKRRPQEPIRRILAALSSSRIQMRRPIVSEPHTPEDLPASPRPRGRAGSASRRRRPPHSLDAPARKARSHRLS